MNALTPLERAFINQFQGGFPMVGRPFYEVAAKLGTTEAILLESVRRLLADGYLSRFGPLYDAARFGGALTLAAMAVPEPDFDAVAAQVNAFDGVAHNYRREHRLNMWFVVAADSKDSAAQMLAEIERRSGLPVYDFPKQREFHLGLRLHLDNNGGVETVPVRESQRLPGAALDELDRRIIAATQAGLPLVPTPYAAVAAQLGFGEAAVIKRLGALYANGVIRRVGAVPNHYSLGLRGNGMTVWDLPDDRLDELGSRIGVLDCVSHCYQRLRHPGVWRYNLFAMVHGRDRTEVLVKTQRLKAELAPVCRAHEVLFSSAVLKKTGLRIAA